MYREFLPVKSYRSTELMEFDFTLELALGETISTQVVTAIVYSGTDPTPASLINGSATASGSIVSQSIQAGLVGVLYELLCTITTSLSQTLVKPGYLAVIPDLV